MVNKVMPNNLEAEESVLGACFLSKYALQKATENLLPESFYNEKNAKIFSSMLALQEEKTPIDLTTISFTTVGIVIFPVNTTFGLNSPAGVILKNSSLVACS